MTNIVRTQEEIDALLNRIVDDIDAGKNPYFGMTYEEGIKAMWEWLTDKDAESPI